MRDTQTQKTVNRAHTKHCARRQRDKKPTEHIQNSAQSTNVTRNQTEHIQNIVEGTNLT